LRDIVIQAWSQCIEEYKLGRVNSERTLQALLFCELRSNLPGHAVLCEPRLLAGHFGPVYPDIVVTSAAEIVSVIELKFVPHSDPVFEGDLGKLARCASSSAAFNILCNPSTGGYGAAVHYFSADCLFVFGVIGHHRSAAVCAETLVRYFSIAAPNCTDRFLPLTYSVGSGT